MQSGNASGARLFSSLPANTSDTLVFTATVPTELTRLVVCNVTAGAATYRLWHVPEGTVGGPVAAHALRYDVSVAAAGFSELMIGGPNGAVHLGEGDMIYVRSGTASALAFNGYGVSADIAPRV